MGNGNNGMRMDIFRLISNALAKRHISRANDQPLKCMLAKSHVGQLLQCGCEDVFANT